MNKLKRNSKNSFLELKSKALIDIKIGKCIKIKNSKKTFQIVGLNNKRNICWVREWPLKNSGYSTFELSVNNILIPTIYSLERNGNS